MKNVADLNLGENLCIFTPFHFPNSKIYLFESCWFLFLRGSANQYFLKIFTKSFLNVNFPLSYYLAVIQSTTTRKWPPAQKTNIPSQRTIVGPP